MLSGSGGLVSRTLMGGVVIAVCVWLIGVVSICKNLPGPPNRV